MYVAAFGLWANTAAGTIVKAAASPRTMHFRVRLDMESSFDSGYYSCSEGYSLTLAIPVSRELRLQVLGFRLWAFIG